MNTNKIIKKIVFVWALVMTLFTTTSCEDLLNRPQLNSPDDETFWVQEDNIRLFANEFYPQFFVGYNSSWTLDYSLFKGYDFSDDFVSKNVQRLFDTSVPTSLGSGANTINTSTGVSTAPAWRTNWVGPTWYFGWIRKANMMINRIETRMDKILTPEAKNHWLAVARFFKAMDYCRLVSVYGDVPYFEAEFTNADRDIMYKDRTSRNEVMDNVYNEFKFVLQNLRTNDGSQRLNRDIAAAFISRWMLFEGTWQKYHNSDNARAKKFLDFAIEASEILMNSGKYAIATDMHTLFGSDDLKGNTECILFRHYDAAQTVTHCVASYMCYYEAQDQSANLDLVKAFICTDGKVWQNSAVSDANKFDLATLTKTRDPRFEASFLDKLSDKAAALLFTGKFVDRVGPTLSAPLPAKYTSNTNTNDAPVIRYGEILMNWIEAKAEAATVGGSAVTQSDIDKSINVLRNRPLDAIATAKGVTKTAPMSLAALSNDPIRDTDVPALIWEVRRERRMELYGEPSRLLDIKRWKKLDYMKGSVKPDILKGIWVDIPKEIPALVASTKVNLTQVMKEDGTIVTFNGNNAADMVGFYLPEGVRDRDNFTDRVYLSPVGKNQIDLYTSQGYKLTQTPGW